MHDFTRRHESLPGSAEPRNITYDTWKFSVGAEALQDFWTQLLTRPSVANLKACITSLEILRWENVLHRDADDQLRRAPHLLERRQLLRGSHQTLVTTDPEQPLYLDGSLYSPASNMQPTIQRLNAGPLHFAVNTGEGTDSGNVLNFLGWLNVGGDVGPPLLGRVQSLPQSDTKIA